MAMMGTQKTTADLGVGFTRQEIERPQVQRELLALPVTALTTSGVTLFTVPDAQSFQIHSLIVSNHTGSAATFDLHIVPSGGSAGTTNQVYSTKSVAANSEFEATRWVMVAPAGSTIELIASANTTLNALMSGMAIFSGDLIV